MKTRNKTKTNSQKQGIFLETVNLPQNVGNSGRDFSFHKFFSLTLSVKNCKQLLKSNTMTKAKEDQCAA